MFYFLIERQYVKIINIGWLFIERLAQPQVSKGDKLFITISKTIIENNVIISKFYFILFYLYKYNVVFLTEVF